MPNFGTEVKVVVAWNVEFSEAGSVGGLAPLTLRPPARSGAYEISQELLTVSTPNVCVIPPR